MSKKFGKLCAVLLLFYLFILFLNGELTLFVLYLYDCNNKNNSLKEVIIFLFYFGMLYFIIKCFKGVNTRTESKMRPMFPVFSSLSLLNITFKYIYF